MLILLKFKEPQRKNLIFFNKWRCIQHKYTNRERCFFTSNIEDDVVISTFRNKSHGNHGNSTVKTAVIVLTSKTTSRFFVAWDQAPHWGKRKKRSAWAKKKNNNISSSEVSREVFFLFLFSIGLFPPTAEPGPRLAFLEMSFSSLQNYVRREMAKFQVYLRRTARG